jgi:hypothetical protein
MGHQSAARAGGGLMPYQATHGDIIYEKAPRDIVAEVSDIIIGFVEPEA